MPSRYAKTGYGATLLKFGFEGFPRYAIAPILLERTKPAFKLGFLRTGQGKPRQTNDLIRSERFHAFQPTKTGAGKQGLTPAMSHW
jgi:hypothetical protein